MPEIDEPIIDIEVKVQRVLSGDSFESYLVEKILVKTNISDEERVYMEKMFPLTPSHGGSCSFKYENGKHIGLLIRRHGSSGGWIYENSTYGKVYFEEAMVDLGLAIRRFETMITTRRNLLITWCGWKTFTFEKTEPSNKSGYIMETDYAIGRR